MRSIYLDSCAIIEAVEKGTPEGQALVELIFERAGRDLVFVTSELALFEVLVDPIRGLIDRRPAEEDTLRRLHHDWYFDNLTSDALLIQTLPITREVLIQAAIIRARRSAVKAPDAIHVATAKLGGCSDFVTGDVDLKRKLERDEAWVESKPFRFVDLRVDALADLKLRALS